MSIDTTIESMIDAAIAPKPRVRSGKFNPSSFGYCYRAQYWNRKNEPMSNPPDNRDLRVMHCGKMFHDFVQKLAFKEYANEVLVECDDVCGFADLVGENEVVDLKSQHSKSFHYIDKFKGDDIKAEKYGNWLQVLYYARELGKGYGRLTFISKDDLCIRDYIQPLDKYWLPQLDMELSELRMLWEQEELPKAEPRCKPNKAGEFWQCEYCRFHTKCVQIESKNK